jgi:hypothetical protein
MTTIIPTTPKAIMAALLCYSAIITFSSLSVETAYAHSTGSVGSSSNHVHGRIVSINELLLLQVTPFTAALAIGFTLLFSKNALISKLRRNTNPST